MSHGFDPANMGKLDSPERRKMLPPDVILRGFDLSAGETIVDVGAGTGFFALPAASAVGPSGRVIAVDHSEEMAEELSRRAAEAGLDNLDVRVASGYDLGVDSSIADLVFLATVLHEVDDKPRLLTEALRVASAGGRIGIVEWQAVETGRGPSMAERLEPAETEALLRDAGFHSTRTWDVNESFYLASAIR
jgi:ubiquinone/menaquinone biosynthesis C-methylase UbiE